MTITAEVRTAQLLHEALEEVLKPRKLRSNYIAPEYPADMSTLNAFLDELDRD